MPDRRLYQRNERTRRFNVVNLPRSGAFSKRKILERAYYGEGYCQCATPPNFLPPIGCFNIVRTAPELPYICDWIVSECLGDDFDNFSELGVPNPPYPYNLGCDYNWEDHIRPERQPLEC